MTPTEAITAAIAVTGADTSGEQIVSALAAAGYEIQPGMEIKFNPESSSPVPVMRDGEEYWIALYVHDGKFYWECWARPYAYKSPSLIAVIGPMKGKRP